MSDEIARLVEHLVAEAKTQTGHYSKHVGDCFIQMTTWGNYRGSGRVLWITGPAFRVEINLKDS